MNTNFQILATFTKSFDKSHDNNNNNLHLIASTVLVRDTFNSGSGSGSAGSATPAHAPKILIENLNNSKSKRNYLIIEVIQINEYFTTADELFADVDLITKKTENFFYLKLSFNKLLQIYSSGSGGATGSAPAQNENKDFRDIFNFWLRPNLSEKKEKKITQCLFIFRNIT
jgi:hypothetical protein